MVSTPTKDQPTQPETAGDETSAPPKYDWADPNVPAGNAPPMPRWPLVASIIVFTLWIGFLVAMAFLRITTVSH